MSFSHVKMETSMTKLVDQLEKKYHIGVDKEY